VVEVVVVESVGRSALPEDPVVVALEELPEVV
jgi:hypothetical protein